MHVAKFSMLFVTTEDAGANQASSLTKSSLTNVMDTDLRGQALEMLTEFEQIRQQLILLQHMREHDEAA